MGENRERFFERFTKHPFKHRVSTKDLILIEAMYVLVKHAHRGQMRKAAAAPGLEPDRYFEHPRGVALILIDELQLAVALAIILALGHDSDEDSPQVRCEMFQVLFGDDIASRLRLLSKRGKTNEEYIQLLWDYADWITLIVKAADRLHNLRSLPPDDEKFQRKQIKETREKYLPLFKHMVDITPEGPLQLKAQKLYDMIFAIVGSYETKWLNAAVTPAATTTP